MAEQNYISLKVIVDKLKRNPLLSDLTFETVIDYTVDFMRIVGVPNMFEDKVIIVPVKEYKGTMPPNFVWINQIRYKDITMRSTTDMFYLSDDKKYDTDYTFIIQGGIIHTSIETGDIEISYKAIAIDEDNYPILIDNATFTRALEAYIKVQHFSILYDLNKINGNIMSKAQQDYAWAVGACQTDMRMLDLSKAESFFNSFRTLLIRNNEFGNSFRNNGSR